ncbi:hypothetical protein [Psychrobacillus psychrodurans]|uniref:Chromosome segregation ATPase n=1 Tax=Psychrobacillus psychrodurans TaxID=126157 RepID=A0A9X3LBU0_9BACI|nr:hypothetical protein [Psychrobacillus psychrodurans]MCZ8533334.1 hypothetical protein [Psychrobacillus psychrodurans]
MPTISKIRFTNIVYEGGNKRYTDEIFHFHGENSAIVLENGGGKTVFIQTAIQAVLPHTSLANRKLKDTLSFDDGPAHIAIEWIKNDRPRIYALTAITIFPQQNGIDSFRYVYEYGPNDPNRIENLPFTHETSNRQKRIASHAEMKEYYASMSQKSGVAYTFPTITSYTEYIEKNFQIISDEWKSINIINSAEGDVEKFFEACPNEKALFEKLLIPRVEQSIAAFEKNQFVDIFEKHRDKFQLYKQLNAQLKEYEQIQKQLTNYVKIASILDEQQQQYESGKRLGKKYFKLLQELLEDNKQKTSQIEEQKIEHDEKYKLLKHKQKSYDIAVIEKKLNELIEQHDELFNNTSALRTKIEDQQIHLANVKYANEKRLLNQYKGQLFNYKEALQKMDEKLSSTDLLEQLDEVKAKIRGNYLTEEENYQKQSQQAELNLKQTEQTVNELHQSQIGIEEKRRVYEEKITNCKAIIKMHIQRNEEMAQDLFDDEIQQQQPILELRAAWSRKAQQFDDQNVQLQNKINEMVIKKRQSEQEIATRSTALIELKEYETKINENMQVIKQLELQLCHELMHYLPRVSESTKLYSVEASLVQQLGQLHEKKDRLYSDKLHEERIAFRRVDDYGQQQSFFADPFIAKKIPIWSQQFKFLESAIDYAANDEQLKVDRVLLAITIITTDEEKEKLKQKVLSVSKDLTYPIQIWSLSEVIAISKGELKPDLKLVEPELWQHLSHFVDFEIWQQEAQQKAEASKQERQIVDEERMRLLQLYERLKHFYAKYPFKYFQQLQDEWKNIQSKTYEMTNALRKAQQFVRDADDQLSQMRTKIENNTELKNYYYDKVKKIIEYEKTQQQISQIQLQQNLEETNMRNVLRELKQLEKQIAYTKEQLEEDKNRKSNIKQDYLVLSAKRALYDKVNDIVPVFSNTQYEVLENQYNAIDSQINGIVSERIATEKLIEQQKDQINRCKQQMEQLASEFTQLDEQLPLPIDYKQLIKDLPVLIRSLKEEQMSVSKSFEKVKQAKNGEEAILKLKLSEMDTPFKFTEPLASVKYQLDEEEARLQLQQKQLSISIASVDEQNKSLMEIEQSVRIADAKHSFLAPDVKEAALTVEEENDFSYRQNHFIASCIKSLNEQQISVQKQLQAVATSRDQFIQFCQQKVSEVRLRNTIIDGVKSKGTYEDIVKHQQSMEKTIHMSQQYTENQIKTNDENLVLFIQHIHVHLRKVVEELKQVPRKTKVNIEGEDVFIYRFTIPEWSEEEGLAHIRARIDWIMDQLEQIEKRTADEQESQQKVRNELEGWLSTVQLLRYITQNKDWRIACRKVTNDNRIAKGYETWSRSNAWSGGEKWSKNMALFLGLLNYVAEKRQHISSKQVSRTVILDNPFGKASSEHVLSPVFFIAKQLGFQIIALTAHVEGKFLHDYFPVVYSCRLRSAIGADKLLMETKKTIHQALFQDHNEAAGEVIQSEQLHLFNDE